MTDKKMSELFAQDRYGDVVPLPRPRPEVVPLPRPRGYSADPRFRRYDLAEYLSSPPSAMAVEAGYNDINPRRPYGPPVRNFKPDFEGSYKQDMANARTIGAMANPDAFYEHIMTRPLSENVEDRR